MQKSMGEHVSDTVSNLLPLLGLLAGIFAVMILAAIFLRYRVRKDRGEAGRRRRSTSPAEMRSGDVANVLGKTFNVVDNRPLPLEAQAAAWCVLQGETDASCLMLRKDLSAAMYFPGRAEPPEGAFPAHIVREEGDYQRLGDPVVLGEDWRLVPYRGPSERWLVLEVRDGKTQLWRGKEIPVEGVTMIED